MRQFLRLALFLGVVALVTGSLSAAPQSSFPRLRPSSPKLSAFGYYRGGVPSDTFWRPRVVAADDSLFSALQDFGRRSEQDRRLRARGEIRSLSFQYKNFSYERDFFHVYKGIRLQSFLDGKVDLGLYKHHLYQGMLFGPAGAYLPSRSNRLELMLRWNLNDR